MKNFNILLPLFITFITFCANANGFSAQKRFELTLDSMLSCSDSAADLAASARHAIDSLPSNAQVSLRSLNKALSRNADNQGPSYGAIEVAYNILSEITTYHPDTQISIVRVLEVVERVAASNGTHQ